MKGYFLVYPNDKEPLDVKCDLHPLYATEEVPNDQKELVVEVEEVNTVIESLFHTSEEIKKKYAAKLLGIARAGLVGETAQPKLALKSLKMLKEEMVMIEGRRIKNIYMKSLGIKALIMAAASLILYLLLRQFRITEPFAMYCVAFLGAVLGTWVSCGARTFTITFTQLSSFEKDMMEPWIRLLYIGACSLIFLLFIDTGIASITVGGINSASIETDTSLQAVLGVLCGLAESKIGINIYKKAVKVIGEEKNT